ncbi:MAG TPA: sulfite exporter TauE/SafE family protein [Allosphingosinicella sp.]|nr:sulfite exporter TauE/SafE family protein [Allosphingosinicella sp.]
MFDLSAATFNEILPFIVVGFAAQLVDGALGMAFGVISTTLLVSLGVPPASASASVHAVEVFTTGASGVSHTLHKNVNWRLFRRIVIPGVIGGILGAYVLTQIHADQARPFVFAYLAAIGFYLLWRALRHEPREKKPRVVEPLGLVGGFLDAAGGGGWGPVVTSNLLAQGAHPRKVIGTVNTAEFFLAVTISVTFLVSLGTGAFTREMAGLLIGGIAAAPLGGYVAKRVPARALLIMVGIVLTVTSAYGIWRALA